MHDVLTLDEAALVLRVSVWTARQYVASGLIKRLILPSVRRPGEDSRRILIARADLEDFINQRREA